MAIPKLMGIETEIGIIIKDEDSRREPTVFEFQTMINIVRKHLGLSLLSRETFIGEIENIDRIENIELGCRLESLFGIRGFLSNGARYYVDGPHLEYSTPECLTPKEVTAADKAGEFIFNLSRIGINKLLREKGCSAVFYKDSSDRKGNSYGCHENYLLSRDAWEKLTHWKKEGTSNLYIPFAATRQIFSGAGKIGAEHDTTRAFYQISQRADFIESIFHTDTTSRRPIINLRNEPYADPRRFARFHSVIGEANMSEFSTYLKMATTARVLAMIEDGLIDVRWQLKNPVGAIKLISRDLTCKKPIIKLTNGKRLSALDIQWDYYEKAKECFGDQEDIKLWGKTLKLLGQENFAETELKMKLDWVIKWHILISFLESNFGLEWKEAEKYVSGGDRRGEKLFNQLLAKDLRYHDIDKNTGLYHIWKDSGDIARVLSNEEILPLIEAPPRTTRAYLRGMVMKEFGSAVREMDWDKVVLNTARKGRNNDFCLSIPDSAIELINPLWGGEKDVGNLFGVSNSVQALLRGLENVLNKREGGEQ